MVNFSIFLLQTISVYVIILLLNKKYSNMAKRAENDISSLNAVIENFILEGDKIMSEKKAIIAKSYPLRTIVEKQPTEADYTRYMDLLLEKVKDRYDKALYKYFREIEGEKPSHENYFLLQIFIEPEDMAHFVTMNREFVLNNLDNAVVNRLFAERLHEYIDLEGIHLLYSDHDLIKYTNVSSIAQDSTIIALIAFVREVDKEEVERSIAERIAEVDKEREENS